MNWSYLIIFGILLIYGAISCAAENALSSFDIVNAKLLVKKSKTYQKKLNKVQNIFKNYDIYIASLILANNLCGIISTAVITTFAVRHFPKGPISIVIVVSATIILILQEILPKIIVRRFPEKFLFKFYYFFLVNKTILWLPSWVIERFAWKNKKDTTKKFTKSHLLEWLSMSENEGSIELRKGTLVRNVLDFDNKIIKDYIIPLNKTVCLTTKMTNEQIIKVFHKHKFSRYPVISIRNSTPIGIIIAKDFYEKYYSSKKPFKLKEIFSPIQFISNKATFKEALDMMNISHTHILIVQEKNKKNLGIITFEDILEVVFGEIYDEKDEALVFELSNNEFKVNSKIHLETLFMKYLPENKPPLTKLKTLFSWITEYNHNNKPKNNQTFVYENLKFKYIKKNEKESYFHLSFLNKNQFKKT